ncbi:MAG: hypothetical protein J6N78_04600 [Clostridia bacterium]|nr:hypothetical protein [Clostridia bacterium]
MFEFKELRVVNNKVVIKGVLSSELTDYYEQYGISYVIIDNQTTRYDNNSYAYRFEVTDETTKELALEIPESSILADINNDLLIITIGIDLGKAKKEAPCNLSKQEEQGYIFNDYKLYETGMKYINELSDCNVSQNFIDYILNTEALKCSITMGDADKCIDVWNRMQNTMNGNTVNSGGCGCGK